jgi:hypothetical protein
MTPYRASWLRLPVVTAPTSRPTRKRRTSSMACVLSGLRMMSWLENVRLVGHKARHAMHTVSPRSPN